MKCKAQQAVLVMTLKCIGNNCCDHFRAVHWVDPCDRLANPVGHPYVIVRSPQYFPWAAKACRKHTKMERVLLKRVPGTRSKHQDRYDDYATVHSNWGLYSINGTSLWQALGDRIWSVGHR